MLSKPNAPKDNEIPSLDFVPEGFVPIESHTSSQNQQPIELDFVPEGFVPFQESAPEQYGEDFADKSLAAGLRPFANEAAAAAGGVIPDTAILAGNAAQWAGSKMTGLEPQYRNPDVTDKIADFLNQGLTEDEKLGNVSKYMTRFLSSLFTMGWLGKGTELTGQGLKNIDKLSSLGQGIEKTGSLVRNLGMTEPTLKNVGAATAAGATAGLSKDLDLPWYGEIPAVTLAFILGGAGGKAASNLIDKVPGLKGFFQKQNYAKLGQDINPEAVGDLLKTSLLEKETQFLTEKTLSDLPAELQQKIKETPQLLNDEEINLVLKKGMDDYQNYIKGLEQEYGINLTAGEFTGSPKAVAREDALANKPDVETFDTFTKNRRHKIIRRLETLKHDLSSVETDKTKLGETISHEVDKVYKEARDLRTKNWEKNFEGIVDEPIIPIPNYIAKIKEFSQLKPDTVGNEVAIKAANKKLRQGIQYSTEGTANISPKRVNEILIGHNEDLMRFADKTFSRKQIGELKTAMESDLEVAGQNASSAEMAQKVQKARAAYKADSQLIDQIDESILFSKIDKESLTVPERVAKALENMEPSQAKLTIDALKRSENYGEVIPQVQRHILEQAVKAATKNGVENFNPRLFLQNLPEKATFDILFEGSQAYKEIRDMSVLLKRLWKYEPTRGNSKTAQRQQADRGDMDILKAGVDASQGKWLKAFSSLGEKISLENPEQIAEMLIDPAKRQKILKYVGTNPDKSGLLPSFGKAALQTGIGSP
jgi:hypothetical protein